MFGYVVVEEQFDFFFGVVAVLYLEYFKQAREGDFEGFAEAFVVYF